MLTMAIMFGAALWLLERLAFAIVLLWAWGAAVALAAEAETAISYWWDEASSYVSDVWHYGRDGAESRAMARDIDRYAHLREAFSVQQR